VNTVSAGTGANIDFLSTVNGAQTLNLTAGTGDIGITGIVGTAFSNPNNLSSFTITSCANSTLNDIFTSGNQSYTTTTLTTLNGTGYRPATAAATIDFTGPVALGAGPVTIQTNNGAIAFSGTATIDNAQALTINGGTSTVTLGAAVGGGTALNSLTVISSNVAANAIDLQTVTTSGAQTYTGNVELNGTLSVNTAGSGVSVSGTTSLAVGGGTISLTGSNGLNDITLSGAIDRAQVLNLTAGGGDISLGTIGGTTPITGLNITAANTVTAAAIDTNDIGLVIVATTTNLNGDVSTINGANGGNFSITGDVVTAAGLTLTTNHGGVTDGTFEIIGVVTAAGALTMNVGPGNDISLNDPLNNLPGVITIPFGQDVSLYTRGSIVLGTINVRNLSVYAGRIIAGGITQSGILSLSQTGTFDLGTSLGDIDLSTQPNNIAGVITVGSLPNVRDLAIWNISTNAAVPSFPLTNLQNVTLNFPNCAITLPPINISGFLSVTSGGDITDSGTLTIAGTVTMDSNGNNITLDDDGIGGYTNTFGILSLTGTGADIVVYEAAESTYSIITAATLTAYSTAGDIISSGAWNITGDTTLNAAIDISVGNGSSLGTLYLTGGNVTINENDPTVLGTSNASDLFITSTGEITDSGVLNVTGTSSFTVTGADIITLDSGNTYTDSVTLSSGTGAVSISNAVSTVDLAASTLGGNLTVASAGGDITDSGILSITGISSFTVSGTNIITLDSGNTYTGALSLNSGTGAVLVTGAASGYDLGACILGGSLTLNTVNGSITDTGVVSVTGTSSFTVTGADVITWNRCCKYNNRS